MEDARLIFGDPSTSPTVTLSKGTAVASKYSPSTWLEDPLDSTTERQKQVRFKDKSQVFEVPMDDDSRSSRRSSLFSL